MRVLFSCNASDGHFLPLVPLAHAFRERGDDVVFATAGDYACRVGGFGFEVLPAGLGVAELNRRSASYRTRLGEIPIAERRPYAFTWRFAEIDAPEKIDELQRAAKGWRPDLIVHETADLAAPAVAASMDVRSAQHSFGVVLPPPIFPILEPAIAPLWQQLGLAPEPYAGLYRGAYISVVPDSLQRDAPPAGTPVHRIRLASPTNGSADWAARLRGGRPVVYVTLGTQFNDVVRFRQLLTAVADADCMALLTVGTNLEPSELGALPTNAIVERFIPQADILPFVDVVVCHGGSGSTYAALGHGVPLVLLPEGADQFDNATAVTGAGAGITVMPADVSAGAIRDAVSRVLAEPSYREAAARLAQEIAAMPDPAEVARALTP